MAHTSAVASIRQRVSRLRRPVGAYARARTSLGDPCASTHAPATSSDIQRHPGTPATASDI
eukprot:13674199-Alexandrium_andersonii.AAC.1